MLKPDFVEYAALWMMALLVECNLCAKHLLNCSVMDRKFATMCQQRPCRLLIGTVRRMLSDRCLSCL